MHDVYTYVILCMHVSMHVYVYKDECQCIHERPITFQSLPSTGIIKDKMYNNHYYDVIIIKKL